MTNEPEQDDAQSQDEWAVYLQVFLDESDDDLESLSQALLRLESDPHDADSLNEAFRLLHTHKGSAGLMGFEGISQLAHELENRFDQYRSQQGTLDRDRITVLLRCVDFLKTFNQGLRAGQQPDQDGTGVLAQLEEVERRTASVESITDSAAAEFPIAVASMQGGYRLRVVFEEGLQLADMKARLIVARLSNVGEIVATDPSVDDMQSRDDLSQFTLIVVTDHDPAEVRQIANVDGVKHVLMEGGDRASQSTAMPNSMAGEDRPADSEPRPPLPESGLPKTEPTALAAGVETDAHHSLRPEASAHGSRKRSMSTPPSDDLLPDSQAGVGATQGAETGLSVPARARVTDTTTSAGLDKQQMSASPSPESKGDPTAIAATVRVGIGRLDTLMNLTGELVVTRARLAQVTEEMNSVFRAARISNQATDLTERLRGGLNRIKEVLAANSGAETGCSELLSDLGEDVDGIEQEFAAWDQGRRHFARITESVDQLSRVSSDLQQSVLDTRMVPVAPLFNRFRRVIRDLAAERNKQIRLEIRGEKTELDKRMIDELGDPLLHLVRNSLDHGLELPEQRRLSGKSETGTIVLAASHRGNNVFITISDDGSGLDLERIRQRILRSSLSTESALSEMSEQQIVDFIWHPGFSTASEVTDISGRGVGMDIVNTRIAELNGSIEVETRAGLGVTFHLRLPLTLAIIRCLLVRFRTGMFSIPIDDVREIVSVASDQIHCVHGAETIEVRGEFIPLARMDRVYDWQNADGQPCRVEEAHQRQSVNGNVNVVILHATGRTLGLCVDELCGSADIVIKSLSDNFVNIQGLAGASIMGDGAVCLMVDTNEVIKTASSRSTTRPISAKKA